MQKILKNRLAMISGITGLFLLFVSFFLGTGPSTLINATSNRFELNVQPIVIAIACIAMGIYIINVIRNYKGIEIKATSIFALVVYSLLFVLCIYFIIVHFTVKSNSDFLNLVRVRSNNFYGICVLMKYLLTFIALPSIGLMALFMTPSKEAKKTNLSRFVNPICFGICAIFLVLAAVTCLPGINNSLITLSRFNGASQAAPINSLAYMTHYNVNGMSIQQLNMIQKMISASFNTGNQMISVPQMRYAITLLVSYLLVIVSTIACLGINLGIDFKYGGIVDDK